MIKNCVIKKDLSVVFGGEAGQGTDTIAFIISQIYKKSGFHVCATKEYMSRIRGGSNSSEIRISRQRVDAYTDKIDLLFALSPGTVEHLEKRITEDTFVYEVEKSKPFKNTFAAGIFFGLTSVDKNICEQVLKEFLKDKKDEVIDKNLQALNKGYETGQGLADENNFQFKMTADDEVKDEIFMSGTEAVAVGCLAGGCNFVSSYPMSPSTGVFIQLCDAAEKFGIVTEQAEDEISAMNMNLGAWYAGARAFVSTSGGGFALMTEALSLAGMIESPMVIHIGQRPGPATGLPTNTEQGDLELALYAGHGEFPRIIYAPGTLQECYELSKQAFISADKYQMPVFILTDQYLLDRSYNTPEFKVSDEVIKSNIVKTERDYKRYKFTDNGISPRGIPGFGEGLVCVDGDEHDEEGHLTEDLDLRVKMINKRRKKIESVLKNSIAPELIGNPDYEILLVGWGSAKNSIIEAVNLCGRTDTALLHFKQVYPVPPQSKDYFEKAEKIVAVENNTDGQLARLLNIKQTILRYDGMPFSPDKLARKIEEL